MGGGIPGESGLASENISKLLMLGLTGNRPLDTRFDGRGVATLLSL